MKFKTGSYKTERHFLDFSINGHSLHQALVLSRNLDLISTLWLDEPGGEWALRALRRLLLEDEADFPDQRHSLFVCPECGDLGCGAVTALIERSDTTVVRRDFGYQNDYEQDVFREDYKDVDAITFDWSQYQETLRAAATLLTRSASE